jgi:hypothetical protein
VQPYFDYCSLAGKLQNWTNANYLFENLGWKNFASQCGIAEIGKTLLLSVKR